MIAAARRRIGAVFSSWRSGRQVDRRRRSEPPIAALERARSAAGPRRRRARGTVAGRAGSRRRAEAAAGRRRCCLRGIARAERWVRRGEPARPCAARPGPAPCITPRRAIGAVDRRRRRLPRRLPVRRLPRRRDRPAGLRGPAGARRAPPTADVEDRRRRPCLSAGSARRCWPSALGAARRCAASGAGWAASSSGWACSAVAVILLVDLPHGTRRGRPDLALRRRYGGARRWLLRRARGSERAGSWPDCSTMRGRAEYESTRQEGPQAPEEEDDDAGPQVRPGSQEGA